MTNIEKATMIDRAAIERRARQILTQEDRIDRIMATVVLALTGATIGAILVLMVM